MLKAISVWSLRDNENRPAEDLFAEARAHGFEGIELAIGEKGLVTPESTESDCRALVAAAAAEDLRITSMASGLGWRYPLTHDDEGMRRKGLELVRRSLHASSWVGVDVLLVVPGTLECGDGEGHVPYDVAIERMREGIGALVPAAEETGVTLAIENVWNRVLLSPLEMRDFVDDFDSERVGCYLDVGNMILFGYAEDWVRILGPRISCVHFKDYKREAGTLAGFCDLLEGDVDYPAVMRELRDVGYDGPCVAEFFGLGEEALAKLSGAMDDILAM